MWFNFLEIKYCGKREGWRKNYNLFIKLRLEEAKNKKRIIKDSDFSQEKRIDLIKRVMNWIYKAIYLLPDEKEMEIKHLKILI